MGTRKLHIAAIALIAMASLALSCGDMYSDLVEDNLPLGPAFAVITPMFVEDFESGSDGWINDGGDSWFVSSDYSVSGSYSLYIMANGGSTFDGLHYEFPAGIQPSYIGFWIRKTWDGAFVPWINIGDDNTPASHGAIWFSWDDQWNNQTPPPGEDMFVTGPAAVYSTSTSISATSFHHVEFRNINFIAQIYDFYVDGACVMAAVPFHSATASFTRFYISVFVAFAQPGYIDDIEIW